VTFLFTDIEGSTRLWQAAPEAMRKALERHDSILRSTIDGHGGYVFSTGGDGFGVAFARTADAVAAAADAQAALGVEPWPGGAQIRVRMGLHTGEAEERDGDYFGAAVNRTARLMAVGHGGQVLCSSATAEVMGDEVSLVDLGEHRLRDLDRPLHVFQLGAGSFAALRSLDVLPGNLPSLTSSFVGRHEELAAVAKEVGAHRLVTLTGVGGVGKTRLALQVAAELLPGFADGAWVCELAAAATDDDVAQVVALALGVAQRQGMTVAESIVDFVRARQLLVVLDNCEHVLDAAAVVVEMVLAGASGVRILATSQEGLGVPGEHVWPVRSLSVAADPARAASSDAVVLFAERARAASPGFVLDEARTPGVVEVCRRLDGIPLAIELAAARVAMMTPAEIAGHLDERFRLLTGGRRGRVKRHQTLHAALEWSYSLLADTERQVFARLGVFPASFDESAAVAVCGGDGMERWDVLDALGSLVAKSMVGADPTGDATRYQLLETLRHFARDRAGDLDGLRRRHAAHYAAFAEQAGAGLPSAEELRWRARVTVELDNVRAAAAWAFDAPSVGDLALGITILGGLNTEPATLYSTGMYAMAATALPRLEQLGGAQRCVVLNAAAHVANTVGDYEQGRVLGLQAIAAADALSTAWNSAMGMIAVAHVAAGDAASALALLAEGRRRVEAEGAIDWVDAGLHSITSFCAMAAGDFEMARSEAEQSLAVARRVGSPTMLTNALGQLACAILDDKPQEARAAAEETMRLVEAGAADHGPYGIAAWVVAVVGIADGDTAGAARAIRAAVEQAARVGWRLGLAGSLRYATLVVAASAEGSEAAATLIGATNGPVLGRFASSFSSFGLPGDRALEQVSSALGHNQYAQAERHGEEMTYDEIIAYTRDQLDRLADFGTAPHR